MEAHRARAAELDDVVDTLAAAFQDDPAWSWVFRSPEERPAQLTSVWRLLVGGALDFGWVWTTPGFEAATVWIPPGEEEFAEPQASLIGPLFEELLGPDVGRASVLIDGFETARPAAPEHYYLSLLGTRPDRRGRGLGMALVAGNLGLVDAEGRPAYLESTNPANLDRYRSVGFDDLGGFVLPGDGPEVTTMWREAR